MMTERPATWHSRQVLTALLAVFLLGGAVGAYSTRIYYRTRTQSLSGMRSTDAKVLLTRLESELNLTAEQSVQLREVLDDFAKYVQTLQVQMDETRATGRERIKRVLNEQQNQRFEQMLKEVSLPSVR